MPASIRVASASASISQLLSGHTMAGAVLKSHSAIVCVLSGDCLTDGLSTGVSLCSLALWVMPKCKFSGNITRRRQRWIDFQTRAHTQQQLSNDHSAGASFVYICIARALMLPDRHFFALFCTDDTTQSNKFCLSCTRCLRLFFYSCDHSLDGIALNYDFLMWLCSNKLSGKQAMIFKNYSPIFDYLKT